METDMPSRRDVLRAAATAAATMVARPAFAEAERRVIAPYLERGLEPGLGLWTRHAGPDARLPLPARVHAVTLAPGERSCVAVARRPGRFGIAVDLARFERSVEFQASPGRHFFGHGVFGDEGRLFLTTENDGEAPRGLIGVRDATRSYRQVGEWECGGVGPHDLALSADGRFLLVANGGIDMSQDFGRAKLNEGPIASSIARIDVATGRLAALVRLEPENASLSIRHLAVLDSGAVVFGCQETMRDGVARPLVGVLDGADRVRWLSAPEGGWQALAGYIGEVAVDRSSSVIGATAPLAGLCVTWSAATGDVHGFCALSDCCGIGGLGDGFVVTSGRGEMVEIGTGRARDLRAPVGFDNHLAIA
jgi:uncharacterized protein